MQGNRFEVLVYKAVQRTFLLELALKTKFRAVRSGAGGEWRR